MGSALLRMSTEISVITVSWFQCETLKLEYLSVFEKDVTVSLSKLSRVVSRIDETRSMVSKFELFGELVGKNF